MRTFAHLSSYSSAQLSSRSQICTSVLALRIWCEQECPDLHGLQLYNKILTAAQLPPHSCTLLVVNLQALLVGRLPSYSLPSPPSQAINLQRPAPLTTCPYNPTLHGPPCHMPCNCFNVALGHSTGLRCISCMAPPRTAETSLISQQCKKLEEQLHNAGLGFAWCMPLTEAGQR